VSALATRDLIGQAQGIPLERLEVTGVAAFPTLTRLSQSRHVKLRGVTRRVVETAEVPPPGRPAERR